jgi:hypothetical protein
MAAALSFLVIVPFQAYVSLAFVRRHVPVPWRALAGACGSSAVVTGCSAAGPLCVVAALGFRFDVPVLAALLVAHPPPARARAPPRRQDGAGGPGATGLSAATRRPDPLSPLLRGEG